MKNFRDINGVLKVDADSNFDVKLFEGEAGMGFHIVPPVGGEVQTFGSFDGENFHAINFTNISSGEEEGTITGAGDYHGLTGAYRIIRFKTSVGGSEAGSVVGRASQTFFFSKKIAAAGSAIARLLNVNLNVEDDYPLEWVGSNTAANTFPKNILIVPKGGIFVDKGQSLTDAQTSLVFTEFPAEADLDVSIKLDGDEVDSFTTTEYSSLGEWMTFLASRFGVQIPDFSAGVGGENDIVIFAPNSSGPEYNGKVFTVEVLDGEDIVNLYTFPAMSGGLDFVAPSAMEFKLDDVPYVVSGSTIQAIFAQLTPGVNKASGLLVSLSGMPVFKAISDYILSITNGAKNACFVDICVLGEAMPETEALPACNVEYADTFITFTPVDDTVEVAFQFDEESMVASYALFRRGENDSVFAQVGDAIPYDANANGSYSIVDEAPLSGVTSYYIRTNYLICNSENSDSSVYEL